MARIKTIDTGHWKHQHKALLLIFSIPHPPIIFTGFCGKRRIQVKINDISLAGLDKGSRSAADMQTRR